MKAMREKQYSAPGEDGVHLGYLPIACDEVQNRVNDIERNMHDKRSNERNESAKILINVPLFEKGHRSSVNIQK